jgi:hypothetical protein
MKPDIAAISEYGKSNEPPCSSAPSGSPTGIFILSAA